MYYSVHVYTCPEVHTLYVYMYIQLYYAWLVCLKKRLSKSDDVHVETERFFMKHRKVY